jgi:CheY-like chemotaxis protein
MLTLSGHHAQTVNDGSSALAIAQTWLPHVVLLDMQMPGMNGYEVARCFRNDLAMEQVFIVSISGDGRSRDRKYGQSRDRKQALEAGCDEHLVKPVEPEVLLTLLKHLANLKKTIGQSIEHANLLRAQVRKSYQLIRQSRELQDKRSQIRIRS